MSMDALVTFIEDQLAQELYSYVLLDPLAVSKDSDQSILQQLDSILDENAFSRVYRQDIAHAPQSHPILVCLATPGTPPNKFLLEITAHAALGDIRRRRRYVCGWLFSEACPSDIAHHLTSMCRIPSGPGTTAFYPIFEPVRFELFATSFGDTEKGPWWPVKHWLFLTSSGTPARVNGHPIPRCPIPDHTLDMQREAVLVATLLGAHRALLERPSTTPLPAIPPAPAKHSYHQIQQARALGLSTDDDILALVLRQTCLHPALHTHPTVRAQIDVAATQQRPLAQIFAQYTDADWKHLIATLPRSEAPA
jgi:hypothetical protein